MDNSYKWAGGGYLSTAEDLVRFGSDILQPGILKEQSLRTLFTRQKTNNGEGQKCEADATESGDKKDAGDG